MGKHDIGLVFLLNLGLVAAAGLVVFFGVVCSPAGYGEDIRLAAMQIGEDFVSAVTHTARSPHQEGQNPEEREAEAREAVAFSISFLSEIAAKKRREAIEEDRLVGLLSRLEESIQENRYDEAREIVSKMEAIAQQKPGDNRYFYLARSVSRLIENAGAPSRYEDNLRILQEELGRLRAERERYRKTLQDVLVDRHFAESALSLQESNAQIQALLLQTLQEQYAESQEALSTTRAQIEQGETLSSLAAKEFAREGYREGIDEARDILEQSLRIRSRDSRIEFLNEARTRYAPDSAMVTLIDTLLERL
jgi:hypothetical protein